MSWIRNKTDKKKTFMAKRVGEIEYSGPQDWRWVPTKATVVDEATIAPLASTGPDTESRGRIFPLIGIIMAGREMHSSSRGQ